MLIRLCLVAVLLLLPRSEALAQGDAIDLRQAVFHNSPNVADWPITTRITRLTMQPEGTRNPGLSFDFSARATWPDYTIPGFAGPIQYTVWAGVRIAGVWHVSGIIRMWRDRASTGAPLLSYGPGCTINNFGCNWVYDRNRWGAMARYEPAAGEAMVFFVTAGNARRGSQFAPDPRTGGAEPDVTSVRERSNVVMVNLPANDTAVFTFTQRLTDLLIDRGPAGLWALVDASSHVRILAANPKSVIAGDLDGNRIDEVIADFGGGTGIWIWWNRTEWRQLHAISSNAMVVGDFDHNGRADVAIDFPATGLYVYWNGASLQPLHSLSPSRMMAGDIDGGGDDLILEYPGYGIWVRRSSGEWNQLHTLNTTVSTIADIDGNGIDDLVLAFEAAGIWAYQNDTSWLRLSEAQPSKLASGDLDGRPGDELVVEFAPYGLWSWRHNATWTRMHTLATEAFTVADLDGNGQAEIVVDFGPGGGVWLWANNLVWMNVDPESPESVTPAQLN